MSKPSPSEAAESTEPNRERSKTVATWLAVLGGSLGLHRVYLRGWRDRWAWLHPLPTLAGLLGVVRLRSLGQDDALGALLAPLAGLMIAIGMLAAIVIGLTSDERWAAQRGQPLRPTGWGPVLGVIAALALGGVALMSTLAYGGQKLFEFLALRS